MALMLCLSLSLTSLYAQTTHIVNNNVGTAADFTDLQAAIDAATNGDIIHVQQSSTSYGNVTLNKELTIIGRSHSDANYRTTLSTLSITEGASNSAIKGININSIGDAFSSSGTINDLAITDCNIGSLNLGNFETYNNMLLQGNVFNSTITIGTNTSQVLIVNNIINSSSISFSMADTLLFSNNIIAYFAGVTISNNTTDLLNIANSIFVADYQFGNSLIINLSSSSGTFQIQNCLSYSYNAVNTTYNFQTGANITLSSVQENVDPLFTNRNGMAGTGTIADQNGTTFNPNIDDLTLQAGSTFINDGIYEGYNYKPLGTPTGLPSIKIDSYDTNVPKNSDLTVTITTKTN